MRMHANRWMNWTVALVLYAVLGAGAAYAQVLPLGAQMPLADQTMANTSGGQASIAGLRGERGTVVVFWSNQCPWVDRLQDRVFSLANEFRSQGVSFILVNSNDPSAFPKESLAESQAKGYALPYLMDADSRLAAAFGAERTPHIYLFDANNALVYVGALDDSPGDPGNVQKSYLRDALTALGQGSPVAVPQTKAFGCTIKLKN